MAATEASLVPLNLWRVAGAGISSALGGLVPSTVPVLVKQEHPVLGQQEMLKKTHASLQVRAGGLLGKAVHQDPLPSSHLLSFSSTLPPLPLRPLPAPLGQRQHPKTKLEA